MNISVIHPSRERPEQAYLTAKEWLEKRDHKISYLLIIDVDDPEKAAYYKIFDGLNASIFECENHNHSCITAINYGATITGWDLVLVASDDMDCPEHWDTLLLKALSGKSDYCVKVKDGAQPFIMTLPIMDRKYYGRFGYIYHPDYKHMFCDTEMSCVAWMLGKYTEVDIEFKHNHYSYGVTPKDLINVKNDQTWGQGEWLFKSRRRINFGLPLADIVNKDLPDISGLNVPRYR